MILLPYQMRAYHRLSPSPSSIQSADDMSEDNRCEDPSSSTSGMIETKEAYRANTLPIIFFPTIIPLPKSLTWIKLRDNFRVDDQTVLRYIPYFGDDDFGFDMSAYEYVPWELEGDIGGEVIETTISTIMKKYEQTFEQEESGEVIDLESKGNEHRRLQASSLEASLMKLFSLSLAQLRQAKKHGDMYSDLILSENKIEIPPQLEQRLIHRFGSAAFLPLLLRTAQDSLSHQLKDMIVEGYGYRNKSEYKYVAENYVDMFCRRCYKYDCRTHGIEQPKQRFHEDPLDILVVNENGAIITETSYNKRIKRKKNQVVGESLNEGGGATVNDNIKGIDENEEKERGEESK
jgi:hypothetical protein